MDNLGHHQIKNLCASKDIIKKVKTTIGWEKIFINHVPDEGPVSRIYKELIQLNNKKTSPD